MGLFDKAKEFASDPDNVAKAKEHMTDENVGSATDKLKQFAPDQADGAIDSLGERATAWGGGEESGQESGQEPAQQREAQPQAAERQDSPQQEREGGRGEGREGGEGRGEGRHGGRDDDGPGRHGGGGRD
ncbi:hypothetical protein APR04_002746 [Promicromonospora umidemergens]|uniref:Antitoxin protein of toxin-antitoxin system n=1 Tax=Promicromonospora umidemergens TaxID=629679 RepID=A0ABP8WHU1_9MICO|nr:hypothetical protein [Promicromonospora umidemergens]MCP2283833.1 hypothetical protein [Promicromonospora umidemergens]